MTDLRSDLGVSRETLQKLEHYADLLTKWNQKINLVAPGTLAEIWTRHFQDSTQLFTLRKASGYWVDLGSGGGFPGLVIAILSAESGPDRVTLIESDQRKAAFLRTVIRELGLPAGVLAERIETAAPQNADVVSARALASLKDLLGHAERHLGPGGIAIFPKGEKAEQEIAQALEHWQFTCEKHPSLTDAGSTILLIGDIVRV